jgi:antitoxin ParD1/3/4/toxin ParE1/3/4
VNELPVVFSARAEARLDEIEDFFALDDPEAAGRLRREIVAQAIRLGENPEMGLAIRNPKPEHRGVRLWPVTRHRQYLILYRIDRQKIRIATVLNAAQDWTRFFRRDS